MLPGLERGGKGREARRDFGHTPFYAGKTAFSFIFVNYGCGHDNFKRTCTSEF